MFLTKSEIIDNFISQIMMISPSAKEDIAYTKNISKEEMIRLHHSVGQYIRNEYKLWNPMHPETKQWHSDRAQNLDVYMAHGLDCHPCHPDSVSMDILYEIWERIHNGDY
jgi:hypothetical protein